MSSTTSSASSSAASTPEIPTSAPVKVDATASKKGGKITSGGKKYVGGGGKRHMHLQTTLPRGITRPVIYRLAHAGGIKRMQRELVDASRKEIEALLNEITGAASLYMEECRRKTIMLEDVVRALKLRGRSVYGK